MGVTQYQIGFDNNTINDCFKNHYVVPDYQREYVWDLLQVEQLLYDLNEGYSTDKDKEYFLGAVVTYLNDNIRELIDGQQRLTTFYIILCALRRIYLNNAERATIFENLIFSPMMNENGDTVPSYHLRLQYEEASNYLELIYHNNSAPKVITESGKKMFNAYEAVLKHLSEHFSDFTELKKFAFFFLNKTKFVEIKTFDINEALKIFETINQRGIGLNPMDLLKNMIFRQVDRSKFQTLNTKWKEIVSALESIQEKPLRFLRYFIISNFEIDKTKYKNGILREDQIYEWMKTNNSQCHYEEKPFDFIRLMKENVDRYISFMKPESDENTNKKDEEKDNGNTHLRNIPWLAGNSYKLHLMLLLSASSMDENALIKFKKIVESIVYYTVINRISANYTERVFVGWCSELRNIKTEEDLSVFTKNSILPIVDSWKENHKQNFNRIGYKSMQQYRLKFIMARIFSYVDGLRLGKNDATSLSNYLDSAIEIEHIMPLTCYDKSAYKVSEEDFEICVNKLGNLTLLENSINKSIHNDDYANKVTAYKKSTIYLTSSISLLEDQGNSAITRTNEKLKSWNEWTGKSIDERQEMLYNLSEEIWRISEKSNI